MKIYLNDYEPKPEKAESCCLTAMVILVCGKSGGLLRDHFLPTVRPISMAFTKPKSRTIQRKCMASPQLEKP